MTNTTTAQQAERAATRIRELKNPTHADYKRIIDEEYAPVDDPEGICIHCGREEYHDVSGFSIQVSECRKCDRPVCDKCCECDYDLVGDPPHYVCTQWQCEGGC